MERLEISKLFSSYEELGGKEITVCGWIKTLRDSKAIGFMEINDGSSFKSLQVVFESTKVENYKDIVKLNVGAAVRVTGTFILTPQANQPFELNASSVEVEGQSTPDYPLQKKRHTLEYMRTIAHLRPRANIYSAAFRVRSTASQNQYVPGSVQSSFPDRLCDSSVLPGERFRLCAHSSDYRKRLRGRRRDVQGNDS